jgi:hypothetical protein
MTDQPVQPEATTKAGQALEAWLREPENYEWGRKVTNAILAIEAEAVAASQERPPIGRNPYLETSPKRIAWEYGYAAGLGAASQERPPLMVDGLAYDEVVTERAASQERPHTTEADALLREWVEHHQPEGYEGIQDCSDINDRTEAYLAAAASQERPHGGWKVPGDPSIDGTDFATDEELNASIRRGVAQERPPIDVVRLAKAMALVYVTGHPIHEAVEHWESYRTDATELIAAYGAAEELDD